jgi:serine/threonine-protein kinase
MREFAGALRRVMRHLDLQSSSPTLPVLVPRVRKPRFALLPWIAGLILVVATLAGLAAKGVFETKKTAVAILPFAGADDSADALARGLAESVGARIASLERFESELAVIPTSELASRHIEDLDQAKKAAGATVAIAGLMSRGASGALRLDLEFNDSRTGEAIRTSVEDRGGDVAALEQRATGQITAMLDLRSASQIRAAVPASRKSYEAYLRGLGYLQRWDKTGNLDQALAAFTGAVRDNGQFALAYVGLAEASRTRFRTQRDPADVQHALNYARQALQIDPQLADAHVALGRALQDASQRDMAVLEFRKAFKMDARHWQALLGMARVHEELGDPAEAEVAFRRAVMLSPYSWSARNNLASFYIRQHRFHDAEAQFRRALVLTPDNAPLLSNLGVVLSRQGRTKEALEAFERSIQLGPAYAAHVNSGNIRYRDRQFRAAVAAYDKALQLNGKDFRVWGTKAQALRLGGADRSATEAAYREAIRLAEQALQTSPGQPRTASLLAIYAACVGDRERAERALRQALAQGGGDRDVLMDAAVAYEVLGEKAQAIRWARTALAQGYSREEFRADPDLSSLAARI